MEETQHGIGYRLRVAVIGRNPRRTVIRIFILAAICWVVFKFLLLPMKVDGISMLPTYQDGAVHFINRLAYISHGPQRGDVVGIRVGGTNMFGRTPSVMYLKRIIGLPGETLQFSHGEISVDGTPLAEPYLKLPSQWDAHTVHIEPNHYFVVGDNRSMPWENHYKGKVPREYIVGDVLF